MRLHLELPWPPSVNHYWRSIPLRRRRGGMSHRVVISREGRAYRRDVCARLRGCILRPMEARLHVRVLLHPPTHRALDIDNRMKGLLDAMERAGVYHDDSQIDRLEIERGEVIKGGKATIWIDECIPRHGLRSDSTCSKERKDS